MHIVAERTNRVKAAISTTPKPESWLKPWPKQRRSRRNGHGHGFGHGSTTATPRPRSFHCHDCVSAMALATASKNTPQQYNECLLHGTPRTNLNKLAGAAGQPAGWPGPAASAPSAESATGWLGTTAAGWEEQSHLPFGPSARTVCARLLRAD